MKLTKLILLLGVILLGMMLSSCEFAERDTYSGALMAINLDGTGFSKLMSIAYNQDPLYGYYSGFGYMHTTKSGKLLYSDCTNLYSSDSYCSNSTLLCSAPYYVLMSPDGQYIYYNRARMNLNNYAFTFVRPDSSYTIDYPCSVSPDNKYVCYQSFRVVSGEGEFGITLHNTETDSTQYLFPPNTQDYSLAGVYSVQQDRVYYTSRQGLFRIKPDGSELQQINTLQFGSETGHQINMLPGQHKVLLQHSNGASVMDLETLELEYTFRFDPSYASAHDPLISIAYDTTMIFYVVDNNIRCYDWQSGEDSMVMVGDRHSAKIHTGLSAAWDASKIFFAGKVINPK